MFGQVALEKCCTVAVMKTWRRAFWIKHYSDAELKCLLSWSTCKETCIDYCVAGKFGREKVWRIYSFQTFGKVWQINRSAKRLLIVSTNVDGFLVWQITDDLPNSPNFPSTKLSHYTVIKLQDIGLWHMQQWLSWNEGISITVHMELKSGSWEHPAESA